MIASLAWPFYNREERRPRAGWRLLLQIAMLAVLAIPIRLALTRAGEAAADHREGFFSLAAAMVLMAFVFTFSACLAARFLDRRPLDGLGFRCGEGFVGDLLFGVLLGVGLIGVIGAVEHFGGLATYRSPAPLVGDVPGWAYLPAATAVFVGVGVWEEVVFRGYQLTNLAEGFSGRHVPPAVAALGAVFVSSLVFGLAHANNPSASAMSSTNIALAGFMLASGYLLTGELTIPIGLHIGWNWMQSLCGMPVSGQTIFGFTALWEREVVGEVWLTGGAFGPEAGVTGLVAILLGTFAVLGWVRFRRGPLRICPRLGVRPS